MFQLRPICQFLRPEKESKVKKVFITGITGTLGQQVLKHLLVHPSIQVTGYSRDEQKQRLIVPHKNLTLYLGDVRDKNRLVEATRGMDLIFHFAALKCVDTLEDNPDEAIKTNLDGTMNVLHSQRHNNIPRVVLASTDKACRPINTYGFTKALAEKLVLRNSNNVVVRYGNVLGSRGSVVPMFEKTILESGSVNITDTRMTRFFLTQDQAAQFVIQSSRGALGGLKIFNMKSAKMTALADAMAKVLGKPKPKIKEIGSRPGEKIHEDLWHAYEKVGDMDSLRCDKYTERELMNLVAPLMGTA